MNIYGMGNIEYIVSELDTKEFERLIQEIEYKMEELETAVTSFL